MNSNRQRQTGSNRTGDWSVIVINYNGDPFLSACLEAIGRVRLRPKDVFVVDNASTDNSMFEMNAYPWAEAIMNGQNLGFGGGANVGLRRVETSYAVILNPDVELAPDFGDMLVEAFNTNPRLGIAGALLTYPGTNTVQHAGGRINYPSLYTDHLGSREDLGSKHQVQVDIDYAMGAVLGVRMDAMREVGGFDEQFAPVYYEDVDLSTVVRKAGWDVQLLPKLRADHHEGVTLAHTRDYYVFIARNRLRYALKHLTPQQWMEDFVPFELARIRDALYRKDVMGGEAIVGAEGIDVLLRDLDPLSSADTTATSIPTYPVENLDVEEVYRYRVAMDTPGTSKIPIIGPLLSWFNRNGPGRYMHAALAEQRDFNDSIVKALAIQRTRNTMQDYVNREQTAQLLLLALTMLGRLDSLTDEPGTLDDVSEDPV